jgi:hypothetical protein
MSKHLTRQFDLVPMACLGTPITIIGGGAIGSLVALTLAKMGFSELTVIDFDRVAVENMNCQFYRFKDIGKPKVAALRELINDFTGIEIRTENRKYQGKESWTGIVISAVDSMAVRKLIWEAHLHNPMTLAVLDARMGAETALFYAMRPSEDRDREAYPKTLYTDSQAVSEPCTARAIMYTATMLSGLVAKTAKDVAAAMPYTRTATWSIKKSQFQGWVSDSLSQASASASPVGASTPEFSSAEELAAPV